MIAFKNIAFSTVQYKGAANILYLSPEVLEYLLAFSDLKSLLCVRASTFRLSQSADRVLASRFQLKWQFCEERNLSPLAVFYRYPTQYFVNLKVPFHFCHSALSCMQSYGLSLGDVQSFLNNYPDGKQSIPYGFCLAGKVLACVLEDGCISIWTKKKGLYKNKILSKPLYSKMIYEDHFHCIYALLVRRFPVLFTIRTCMNPNLKKFLADRQIMACYHTPKTMIATLSDRQLIFISNSLNHQALNVPTVPPCRKVQSISIVRSKLFMVLLDNGQLLCFGRDFNQEFSSFFTSKFGDGSASPKVWLLTSSKNAFTIVLEDRRTIIHYGYKYKTPNDLDYTIFQFPERSDVKAIYSTDTSYVALLCNGKAFAWGEERFGGESPKFPKDSVIREIYKTKYSFAAYLEDSRVITWGDSQLGGCMPTLPQDRFVKALFSNYSSFVALLDDHTLMGWGSYLYGGVVPTLLTGRRVKSVYSVNYSYLAVLENETQVCYWGLISSSGAIFNLPKNRKVKHVFSLQPVFVIQFDNDDFFQIGSSTAQFTMLDNVSEMYFRIPGRKKMAVIDCPT